MGHIRNHAIVVTAYHGYYIERVHEEALKIFPWVSPICPPHSNDSRSFFIPPDGSKEGWDDSNEGDRRREQIKAWLRAEAVLKGGSPVDWVELYYGADDEDAQVCEHSDSIEQTAAEPGGS